MIKFKSAVGWLIYITAFMFTIIIVSQLSGWYFVGGIIIGSGFITLIEEIINRYGL